MEPKEKIDNKLDKIIPKVLKYTVITAIIYGFALEAGKVIIQTETQKIKDKLKTIF